MAQWQASVDRFCYQYLQLEAEPILPSPEILKLSEVQEAIYENAFDDGLCHAPPPRYQHRVLKALVSAIEKGIDDWEQYAEISSDNVGISQAVSDNLMSAMAVLLATPLQSEVDSVQQKRYVTYALSLLPPVEATGTASWPSITLLENRTLLSAGGTTGRRTWEAALHMGQFLCKNPEIVRGKRVFELGAGTGYLSILCARYLKSAHVTASDGSDDVLSSLSENLSLNGLRDGAGNSELVTLMEVKWGHALVGTDGQPWNGSRAVDVVLGADLTYDASAIPSLVATLLDLFGVYPDVEVYIAAAERNYETFKVFLDTCRRNRLHVEDLRYSVTPRAQQTGPFYTDTVDIRACRVINSAGWVYENKL